jgi:uncharacterized protein (DUF1501 family)
MIIRPNRREFLHGAAVVAAASALPALSLPSERKTRHLVLVAFAGGVRTRETFGAPQNVPTLAAMAGEGVLYTRARTSNLGHYGAALSIFTGIAEPRGIRENARGPDPTLFEYLRKDLAWQANEVWITTSGGAQQVNYAYGLHPDYGARYGANTLDGDGIFNREFKGLIEKWGRPRELPEREEELLARMRGALAKTRAKDKDAAPVDSANSARNAAQVEKYILDELSRGTADITGPNAGDAKALRLARNVLTLFKPRVTAVVLQEADIAHGSYNGYVEVVRRNDAALGELWEAVRKNPDLAGSTAFVVVPEFGRDKDLNSRRGLDHGDGSEDLSYVTCLAWGPDFKRGSVVKEEVRVVDVAPTVCEMFGAKARLAHGKKLPGLYA